VQNEWVQAQEEKGNIEAALMIRAVSKELNTISGN
jgi:hypothetical protein